MKTFLIALTVAPLAFVAIADAKPRSQMGTPEIVTAEEVAEKQEQELQKIQPAAGNEEDAKNPDKRRQFKSY